MARRLTTGFELDELIEHNGTIAGLGSYAVQSTYKRTGNYALECSVYNFIHPVAFTHTLSDLPAEIYLRVGFMYRSTLGVMGGEQNFMACLDGGTAQIALGLDRSDFTIVLTRGGTDILGTAGATELARGTAVLHRDVWYVLEIYVKIANSGGQVTVKVNGVTDISFTGDTQATANARVSNVQIGAEAGGIGQGSNFYFDDVAINDITGSFQNSYPGTGGVYLLKPNGVGANNAWTPSAAVDHYTLVDEIPKNTSDWVSDDVSGNKDSYLMENLPAEVISVALVEVLFQAALAQAGSQNVKDLLRHSAVDYLGAAQAVTTEHPNYALFKGAPYYEVAGGAGAWTPAQVNALEAGVAIA